MALFENYEGRMPQLQPVLDKYGFKSFEDVKKDLVENMIPSSDKFNFIDDYNDKFVKD